LLKQDELELALLLTCQQIVDLAGKDRGLDKVKFHLKRLPQWSSLARAYFMEGMHSAAQQTGRVGDCLLRELEKPDEGFFHQIQILRNGKLWDLIQIREPPLCRRRIATGTLIDCKYRREKAETHPLLFPPFSRGLLVNGDARLATRPRSQASD